VIITTTIREAKLKPESAERYPTLPARMWTSAVCLAELVGCHGGERIEPSDPPGKPYKERTLSEVDFEFRGGLPRGLGGLFTRTRTSELVF
jgi:hypothetical protein